jgi:hypothetical protein
MNIEIKIDELTVDTIIAKTFERDEDGDIIGEAGVRLGDAILDRLTTEIKRGEGSYFNPDLRSRIKQIRDEEIRSAVLDEITAALTVPIQATNGFGERTGAPTTLREMIFKEAQKALGTTDNRNQYNRSLIEKVIDDEIRKALTAEIKPILDKAKSDVKVAADRIASELLAQVALKVSGGK